MDQETKYEIGGKTFYQLPLMVGQYRLMWPLVEKIVDAASKSDGGLTTDDVMELLGSNLFRAFALVLIPEGESRADHLKRLKKAGELEEMANWLEANLSVDTMLKGVTDFFEFNPLSPMTSLLGVFQGMVKEVGDQAATTTQETSSSTSKLLSPSPAAQGQSAVGNS